MQPENPIGEVACQLDSPSSVGTERGSMAHVQDMALQAHY